MASLSSISHQARILLSLTIALLAISSISVVLRLFVRARRVKVSANDYCMVLAQLFFVATCVFFVRAAAFEILGSASDSALGAEEGLLTREIKIATVLYAFAVNTAKLAIGTWLPNTRRWQRVTVNSLLGISTVILLAFMAMLLFPCSASSAKLSSTCNPTRLSAAFTIAWSISNAVVDIIIAAIALSCLIRDSSPRNAKLLGALVYLVGLLVLLAATARCVMLLGVISDIEIQRIALGQTAVIEAGLLITAGALATMRPLFGRALGYVRDEQLDYQSAAFKELQDDDDGSDPRGPKTRPRQIARNIQRRTSSAHSSIRIEFARLRAQRAMNKNKRRHGIILQEVDLSPEANSDGFVHDKTQMSQTQRPDLTSFSKNKRNPKRQFVRGSIDDPLAQHSPLTDGFRSLLIASGGGDKN